MAWIQVWWARTQHRSAADELVHEALATHPGRPSTGIIVGRLCARCGSSSHGRPYVGGWSDADPPAISISRTPGVTAVAVAPAGPVGLDVEAVDRFGDLEVAPVVLHPDEEVATPVELAVAWTRKEAVLKALGSGLDVDPRRVWVGGGATPPPAPRLAGVADDHWLHDVELAPGLRGSVAGRGVGPERLTVREVAAEALRGAATRRRGRPADDRW